jgi:hypothetical protein
LKVLLKNIASRDLVFVSFNPKDNAFLKKIWLTWDFDYNKQTDFNYPFFISIWGNKTDRYIKDNILKM